ncbi:MAG: D-alanyl-D-alanine carboxypeptidase family protein [Candidatus Saccharibacteria bacterium]|nr:D-alanyl-D-alanine carboxypeptidase family protein [Candidatus Saccharibacteria bacterium]
MQPGAVKDREGHAPDPNDDDLNPANNQSSSDSNGGGFWQPEGWDNEYPGDEVTRPNKNNSPNIANEETNATPELGGLASRGLNSPEKDMSAAAAKSPEIITKNLTPPAKGVNKFIIKGLTRKNATRAGVGMGGLGFLVAMYMAGGALYLQNLTKTLTGPNNRFDSTISSSVQRRRVNSLFRVATSSAKKVQANKLVAKLEAAGFEVVSNKGTVKSLTKTFGTESYTFVLEGKNSRQIAREIKQIAKGKQGEIAQVFMRSLDDVSKEINARFVGPVAKKGFLSRLKVVAFFDWLSTRKATKLLNELPSGPALASAYATADEAANQFLKNLTPADLARRLGVDPNTLDAATTTDDIFDLYKKQADEYRQKLLGANGDRVLRTAAEADREAIVNSSGAINDTIVKALQEADDKVFKEMFQSLSSKVGSLAVETVAKAADITTVPREACRVAGTLEFIKGVRNVMVAMQLAEFAIRLYMIADHQKAGLASAEAVGAMSAFMSGVIGTSGVRSLISGSRSISGVASSSYNIGYADEGILNSIAQFIRRVPGFSGENCEVINNPITMVAGSLAGGALAVLSDGTSYSVSLGWSIALTVLNEVAFTIATPLLINAITDTLLSGFESTEEKGGIAASGQGALSMMSASNIGALPMEQNQFVSESEEVVKIQESKIAQMSVFERYLNINNSDSLVARTSLYMPYSLPGIASSIQGQFSFSKLASSFNLPFSFSGNTAYAADSSCKDVSVLKWDVATDGFCNLTLGKTIILDLDQTEKVLKENGQITAGGEIAEGSAFKKFVENCFSGRTGILHPVEISQEGETDPVDPTCVLWTENGLNDGLRGSYPGDVTEEFEGEDVARVPTKRERMAAWYGWLADEENLIADINDELSGGPSKVTDAQNNKIFFLGDSLTVGMQNLAGTDPSKNYLERVFNTSGWSSQVDAQGCRAVFQTQGPIQGDGDSCPAQTIIDGISAANSKVGVLGEDQMGTVVIGLGTNKYELGENGQISNQLFLDKAQELIDTIKNMSPSSNIFWVNLTADPDDQTMLDRNEALKQLIDSLPETSKVKLLDWNDFVKTANATPSTTDDIGFADSVHHTADGYSKKVQYLLDNIPLPTPADIGPIVTDRDTTDINCATGLGEGSIVTGHENGVERQIKVCDVGGGKIRQVNSQLSGAIDKMVNDAASSGINLSGGAYRSINTQISLWKQRCGPDYPITMPWDSQICSGAQLARPGTSMHQLGLAIDMRCDGFRIETTDSPCFLWLEKNAVNYGLYEWGNTEKLAVSPERNIGEYEPWHWSINGN